MPEEYYLNKLYPLQDEILREIQGMDVDFYLSGGTALKNVDELTSFLGFETRPPRLKTSILNKSILLVMTSAMAGRSDKGGLKL